MKKTIPMFLVLSAILSMNAFATVKISWGTEVGVLNQTAADPLDASDFLPAGSLFLLYYQVGGLDAIAPSGSVLPSDNDILLQVRNNASAGVLAAQTFTDVGVSGGGSVYTRIFNVQNFSVGVTDINSYTLPDGTYYFQSLTTIAPTNGDFPADIPNDVYADEGGAYAIGGGLFAAQTLQVFAIPEPSVFGMLFLGLAFVAKFVRRK